MKSNLAPNYGENVIRNPTFDIRRRGDDFNGLTGNLGMIGHDGWTFSRVCGSTQSYQSISSTPDASEAGYAAERAFGLTTTSIDSNVDAAEYNIVRQVIEGHYIRKIAGKTCVLAFWVKSPVAGIHCVALWEPTQTRSYVIEYEVDVPNVWQKVVKFFEFDVSVGPWHYGKDAGLYVDFIGKVGSNWHAPTAGEWHNAFYLGTANQVNVAGVTGTFGLSHIQLHAGIEPIPFDRLARDIGDEVEFNERYFESSYPVGSKPGQGSRGSVRRVTPSNTVPTSGYYGDSIEFRTVKRDVPTVYPYSYEGIISQVSYSSGGSAGVGSGGIPYKDERQFQVQNQSGVSKTTTSNLWFLNYTASAEL